MKAIHAGNRPLRQRVQKEVEQEVTRQYQEIQNTIQQDIAVQLTAAIFYTLATWHGWGAKRLKRLMKEITTTFEDMSGVGFAGKFDTDDLVEKIKNDFGIDLKVEIKCEPCKTKKGD